MSKILYYRCKKCSTDINPNTFKKLIFCKCGNIGIDGTDLYTRIIGNKKYLEIIKEKKEIFVYRIKHVQSGLYFTPYKYPNKAMFTLNGKFYSKKPSIRWTYGMDGECVIEKYKAEIC